MGQISLDIKTQINIKNIFYINDIPILNLKKKKIEEDVIFL